MEVPLALLKKRAGNNWLIGQDNSAFISLVETLLEEFTKLGNNSVPQKILLVEPDSIRFLAGFIAACSVGHQIFIGNPAWVESEWQSVFNLVKPDLVWGNCGYLQYDNPEPQLGNQSLTGNQTKGWIMIPTGGSSGKIRFAMHSWETLMASVQGCKQYFQLTEVNSICTLPLYHVSGLMQFMRSFTSGGRVLIVPFKELKSGQWCDFDPTEFFISLVPTQLQRLLDDAGLAIWLSQCKTVFIGGAPTWPELLEKARFHGIRLALSYGMTETASQIATLKPEIFLSGNNSSGQVLPHAKVRILSQTGELLGPNQTGIIAIQAASLAFGYYPELFSKLGNFQTDDLGFFDLQGNLNVVGRSSDKIITGGENVFPPEVEYAIRTTNLVRDISVIGLPDQYWGQIITAIYIPCNPRISSQQIKDALEGKLPKFKQPKCWVPVEMLPSNNQGKVNREQLYQIATKWRQEHLSGYKLTSYEEPCDGTTCPMVRTD